MAEPQAGRNAAAGRIAGSFRLLLASTTALVSPRAPANPFVSFSGLTAAAVGRMDARVAAMLPQPTVRPLPVQRVGVMHGVEWAREAYRRLEFLIRGDVKPRTPAETRKILSDAGISIELHTVAGNKGSQTAVDTLTGRKVPLGRVSRELDRRMPEMLGRDRKADREHANQQATARGLHEAFTRGGYMRDIAGGRWPWSDWKDFGFAVAGIYTPSHNPHGLAMSYCIGADGRDGKPTGYFGLQVDQCGHAAEETWAAMRTWAVARGLMPTALPGSRVTDRDKSTLSRHFVFDPLLSPGTPILLRDGNLVPAARVHQRFSYVAMEQAFRAFAEKKVNAAREKVKTAVTPDERKKADTGLKAAMRAAVDTAFRTAMKLTAGKPAATVGKVLDMDAVRAARARRAAADAASVDGPVIGFDTPVMLNGNLPYDPAAVVIRYENGHPSMYEQRLRGSDPARFSGRPERPLIEVTRVGDLPPGRYPVEDEFQMPDGQMLVMQGGRTRRLGGRDPDMQPEQPEPTAPVPAPEGDARGMAFGGMR